MHLIKRKLLLVCLFVVAGSYVKAQEAGFFNKPESSPYNYKAIDFQKAQSPLPETKEGLNKKRLWLVAGSNISLWTISFIGLNKAWYADYPRSSFHFFNDFSEWNQMDKAGHTWTSYHVSRVSAEMWKWTGLSDRKSILLGGLSGIAYQSIIEIQDGFSSEWGFSWGDMSANLLGAAGFAAQQLGWKEQRIQIKLSYSGYNYPQDLVGRRNKLFGNSVGERILKDYNSQTYWVSANLGSFTHVQGLPIWLNLSFGYGSEGMLGGTSNVWTDKSGASVDRRDIPRVRRFFLAPDVDLTKIKTRSKFLHTAFFALNMVKFPAPAIELDSKGRLKGHWLYF